MSIEQVQRFYETLAMIISKKEGVEITVKVRLKEEYETEQKNETCSKL